MQIRLYALARVASGCYGYQTAMMFNRIKFRKVAANLQIRLFLIAFLVIFHSPTVAEPLIVSGAESNWNLESEVELFQETSGELKFARIANDSTLDFRKIRSFAGMELQAAPANWWFRVELQNSTSEQKSLIFQVDTRRGDLLQKVGETKLYIKRAAAESSSVGDTIQAPSAFSPLATAFRVELSPGENAWLYLKIRPLLKVPFSLKLHQAEAFNQEVEFRRFAYGLFFGAMLIMAFYNLSLMFVLKDGVYLYYVGYVLGLTTYLFIANGYLGSYLWPGIDNLTQVRAMLATGGGTLLFASQFTRTFLNTKEMLPAWDKLLIAVAGIYAVFLCSALLLPIPTSYAMLNIILLLAGPLALITGIRSWRLIRVAKYFTLAWATLVLGLVVNMLSYFGILPATTFTSYTLYLGAIFEAGLLSFALAHRINHAQHEKAAVQIELLNTQKVLNEELEERFHERTQELEKLNNLLTRLSTEDSLTGLYNRRYFDEMLETEWQRVSNLGGELSLIIGDIDNFKNFNDYYGHPAGDTCLQKVTQVFQKLAEQSSGVAARYGGEEFVLLLPEVGRAQTLEIAEDIRRAVEDLDIAHAASDVHSRITISLGLVSLRPKTSVSASESVQAADQALYRSKEAGRNRISE